MNWHASPLKLLLLIGLLLAGKPSISQTNEIDQIKKDMLDSIRSWVNSNKVQVKPYYLYQSPHEKDNKNLKKYKYLLMQKPTARNYKNYYNLACSLWELNKLKEAEQLFLNIINSSEEHYSATYHHSSDIPDDTTTNSYGYGSYTSNYKNKAAVYLAKIYITNKQFDKAFLFIEDATKKYQVIYTCGTGFYSQKEEYDYLYACCYNWLKIYDEVL